MLSCPIKKEFGAPIGVSIVSKPSEKPSNMLTVINNKPYNGQKESFAVCSKQLNYTSDDASIELIEWLETVYAYGADKVHIYEENLHPNMRKVIDFYLGEERLEVTKVRPFYTESKNENIEMLQHQFNNVLVKMDCFYRTMNNYKYIVLIDLDEMIAANQISWELMMDQLPSGYPSYSFMQYYFLPDMQED